MAPASPAATQSLALPPSPHCFTESEPSLFSLVEGWLERTPFLAVGDFRFWSHYQDAVALMLEKDRAAIEGGMVRGPFIIYSCLTLKCLRFLAFRPLPRHRNPLTQPITPEQRESQLADLAAQQETFASIFDEEKHAALVKRGDRRLSYKATQAALLITLYNSEPILHNPYRLLTLLVEIDEMFALWRHR